MKKLIVVVLFCGVVVSGLALAADRYSNSYSWDYQVTTGITADSLVLDSLPGLSSHKIFRFDNLYEAEEIVGRLRYQITDVDTTEGGTPIDTSLCYWRVTMYTAFQDNLDNKLNIWSHWMDSASAQRDTGLFFQVQDTIIGDVVWFTIDGAIADSTFSGVNDSTASFKLSVDMKATD